MAKLGWTKETTVLCSILGIVFVSLIVIFLIVFFTGDPQSIYEKDILKTAEEAKQQWESMSSSERTRNPMLCIKALTEEAAQLKALYLTTINPVWGIDRYYFSESSNRWCVFLEYHQERVKKRAAYEEIETMRKACIRVL